MVCAALPHAVKVFVRAISLKTGLISLCIVSTLSEKWISAVTEMPDLNPVCNSFYLKRCVSVSG